MELIKKKIRSYGKILLPICLLLAILAGRVEVPGSTQSVTVEQTTKAEQTSTAIDEKGSYTNKADVALYLDTFGRLPENFITKKQAEKAGWNSKEGNLWEVAPGKSIGGSHFGNYEEQLPEKEGRKYYECDINYDGSYRSGERIIYSNDGLIYYTGDHYKTFEQLYP